MAVTRINNNQITDASAGNVLLGVNAAVKLQNYTVTATKLANNLIYGSDLTVTGNLTVQGNVTSINTVNTTIEDPLIVLADGQTSGAPTVDIGFVGLRGSQLSAAFTWKEDQSEFVTALSNTDVGGTGLSNTTININAYANLHTGNMTVQGTTSLVGNLIGAVNATGNITGGNLLTAGLVSATGNVTGGNVTTAGQVTATSNITGGNLLTGGQVSATGNITGGNIISGNAVIGNINVSGDITVNSLTSNTYVSATANVIGGNVTTGGQVSSTGNVTGGNLLTGGLISATSTITSAANVVGGNLTTAGQVSATSNITGGNVLTGGIVSATSNVTGGNVLTSGIVSATANVTGGNLTTAGQVSATSNITGGNVLTGGILSSTGNVTGGNLNTAGQVVALDSITGGNLYTGGLASVTGNITGGNINTAGQIIATGNITGGNLLTSGALSTSGNIDANNVNTDNVYSSSSLTLTAASGNVILAPSGNVNVSGKNINNLADPAQAQDAATKQYVDDSVSSGITIHTPVYVEAPTALNGTYAQGGNTFTVTQTIAGNTVVFSTAANLQVNDQLWFSNGFQGILQDTAYFVVSTPNTSAAVLSTTYDGAPVANITSATGLTESVRVNSGVGATLTNAGANATLQVDGVTLSATQRVLVYNQANAVQNGVYVVSDAGNATAAWVLTRSSDTNTYGPKSTTQLDVGDYFYVQAGSTGAGESYVMTAPTGPFIFGYDPLSFTQFSASQVYTANTNAGLSLTGTVFSAKVDNITTAFDAGGNIEVKASAQLTTPNIGAATGTSLSVTANVTGGNVLTGGVVSSTGNITGANVNTAGLITATGNITGGNVNTTGNVTGGNLLFGSGIVSGTGNIFADTIFANISGNIDAGGANTEIQFNDNNLLAGSPGFTFDKTSNAVVGTGNITGANLLTGGLISATANITGGNIRTGGQVSATGNITGGNATILGQFIVGPTGSPYDWVINGNLLTSPTNATWTADPAFNQDTISSNTAGYLILNALYANSGISSQVQLDQGLAQISADVSQWNFYANALLTAPGAVSAVGNVTGGNILTGGIVSATSNITGGNILTSGLISATGNITGGNVQGGNIVLTGNSIEQPATGGRITINGADLDTDFAIDGDTVANIFYVDAGTGTASFGNSTQITNALVAFNSTTSILTPVGNTAQRPSAGVTGMLRFNTTNNAMEVFNNSTWATVGQQEFTVIADEQFNGDGSTVAFTLGSTQTTNSCIVSINGVVQIPTIAYSVSGTDPTCVLTFTEAPAPGDLIDVRQITTTTSVTGIAAGSSALAASTSAIQLDATGNLNPTANVTYTLGNATNYWQSLYVGGNTIYLGNLQLKAVTGETFAVFQSDGTTQANIDIGNVDVSSITSGTSTIGIGQDGVIYNTVSGTANVLRVLTTGATITGLASVTGNVQGGNLRTAGLISATGSITGASVVGGVMSGSSLSVSGTVTAASTVGGVITGTSTSVTGTQTAASTVGGVITGTSASVTGTVTAASTVGGVITGTSTSVSGGVTAASVAGGVMTGTSVSVTGAVTGASTVGGIITGTSVSVSGNITGGNVLGGANVNATTHTGATVNVTGNIDGGNLRTSGLISATGGITTGGDYNLTGNIIDTGAMTISTGANGNLTLNPNGTGVIVVNKDIVNGQANGVGNIGSSTTYFNTVFAKATSAQYADLAEKYTADAEYAPGTVVMFGGTAEVTICGNDACRRVAGVISTNPSYIMNGTLTSDHVATVALTGRVPTKVTGTVRKGDLMVSAGNGAARAEVDPRVGTVIGKALEDFDGVEGVIEVVVGRL